MLNLFKKCITTRELPENLDDWPPDWQESYEERVAIMIHHGGLLPEEAEREAEESQRHLYRATVLLQLGNTANPDRGDYDEQKDNEANPATG